MTQTPRSSSAPARDANAPEFENVNFMGYSVRDARYRFTMWVKFAPRLGRQSLDLELQNGLALELYDHDSDPGENVNVAENRSYADVINDLHQKLIHRVHAHPGEYPSL